jgi:putative ABC transport system ATP-binding protein
MSDIRHSPHAIRYGNQSQDVASADPSSFEAEYRRRRTLIDLRNVSKSYRIGQVETPALRGVNLSVFEGEFLAISGHSGSGKSTLLNLLGLLDDPSEGEMLVQGQDVTRLDEKERTAFRLRFVSFVFQFLNLLEDYTALGNILFQLELQKIPKAEALTRARNVLDFMGLGKKADAFPYELSGGEQQRVAIGRALAKDSLLILADEPTAHLDSKNAIQVIELLQKINREYGRAIVMVTHELSFAKHADRVVMMGDGQVLSDTLSQGERVSFG